jgi:hypothetical protein
VWGVALLCLLGSVAVACGVSARTVTLESLLREMVDRDAVARWPAPHYACLQASSYDRTQTDPPNPKTWFANKDYEQFIRVDESRGRKEWVILEHQGPGCITRFWTPNLEDKKDQVIRVYLDGSETPAIEAKFLDLMNGRSFIPPPFAFTSVRAGDLYLPIPFAKSCRITLDSLPFYYNINYRAYDPGTPVRGFSRAALDAAAKRLRQVGHALEARSAERAGQQVSTRGTVGTGKALSLSLPPGPSAVRLLEVRVDPSTPAQALRSAVLEMSCDGEETLWCPLADLFQCPLGIRPVRDWYRSVSADGTLTSRWVMPYRTAARVTLRNLGAVPLPARLSVVTGPWRWDEDSLHFHATWRQQYPLRTRPMSDWSYLRAEGRGVYLGDSLTVMNPVPEWWGEGDEKVYVDGEAFPSHLGTGTEDYYGTAWGLATTHYDCPFFVTLRDTPSEGSYQGYSVPSRVRLLDGIPFSRSLRMDMEVWHWADTQVAYSVATFWYGAPGAASDQPPLPEEAARVLPGPPPPFRIAGAVECEKMQVLAKSPGLVVGTQDHVTLSSGRWSDDTQLFVQATKVGDWIELAIPTASAGPKRLSLYATQSFDYGVLSFAVNGKVAPARFDGYSAQSRMAPPIDLGTFEPRDGRFVLRVEAAGSNPAVTGAKHFFGLDCVTLTQP